MSLPIRTLFALACLLVGSGTAIVYRVGDPYRTLFTLGLVAIAVGGLGALTALLLALLRSRRRAWRWVGWLAAIAVGAAAAATLSFAVRYRLCGWPALSSDAWRHDLAFLAHRMRRVHPALAMDEALRTRFNLEVAALHERIPSLDSAGVVMGLTRLVASLNDGHSALLPFQPATGFHMFPLVLHHFRDGIFLVAAPADQVRWVGARLVRIGETPADELFSRLRPYVGADNEATAEDRIPFYYACPEALQAPGILATSREATFWLQRDRQPAEAVTLRPSSPYRYLYWHFRPLVESGVPEGSPVYARSHRGKRRFEYQEPSGLLYVQLNSVFDASDESLADFGRRLVTFASRHEVRRFVIDLRDNGGGDNTLVAAFVDAISRSEVLNRRGVMYTLIGRHTFSAAVNLTTALENRTRTLFVGEPTGAGPNHDGDSIRLLLPRSRILVLFSTRHHQWGDAADTRRAHEPQIQVRPTGAEYFAGGDPVLDAALFHQEPEATPAALPEAQARRLRGRYAFDADQTLKIAEAPGGLSVAVTDFLRSDLTPCPDGSFATRVPGMSLRFQPGPSPADDAILYSVGSSARVLQRMRPDDEVPSERFAAGLYLEAAAGYRAIRREHPGHAAVAEARLNRLGYEELRAGRPDAAIALFELNTEFHPESSNAFDSLGEACLAKGDRAKAAASYRRAVELDPSNTGARKALRVLD